MAKMWKYTVLSISHLDVDLDISAATNPFSDLATEKSNIKLYFSGQFDMTNMPNFVLIPILKIVSNLYQIEASYARKIANSMLREKIYLATGGGVPRAIPKWKKNKISKIIHFHECLTELN